LHLFIAIIHRICYNPVDLFYLKGETIMTEIKSERAGVVRIADEVLAVIAGTAALEVEGVAGLAGHLAEDIAEKLGRRYLGKGVSVKVENGAVSVATEISVKTGVKIQEVGREVQGACGKCKRVRRCFEYCIGQK
jgi:uncharacterized alkaline shock family protein YloU